jgi:hypothetical protein
LKGTKNIHFQIKKLLFFAVLTLIISVSFAQPYSNSWINYSQQYYKFKVSETGVYRIDSAVLANAGIPLSTINPSNFQLFSRGVEVPLFIEGEGDGVFNGSDFIEFYGEYNDGWFDEPLYGGASKQPNPYYSLFTDTINYYLTWNNLITNNRYVVETDNNYSAYTPSNFVLKEEVEFYTLGHPVSQVGNLYIDGESNSIGGLSLHYVESEGWFDDWYTIGASKTKSIISQNAYASGPDATLESVVIGESNFSGNSFSPDQHLRISVGGNVFDTIFEGYRKIETTFSIPISDLGASSTSVNFQSVNDLGSAVGKQSISYLKLAYPHTLDFRGGSTFDKFFVPRSLIQTKAYLSFNNFIGTGNVIFYELTNSKRIRVDTLGGNYNCLIPNSADTLVECLVIFEGDVKNIISLTPVEGTGTFTDFAASAIDSAFIIITHPSLMIEANDYASYRLNGPSNNLQNAIVFNIEDLYDQFSYGIKKHPYSIRSFMDYIVDVWPSKPNYLFLLGKSIKPSQSRKNSVDFANNLVPSYGDPSSDIMLTAGLNGTINDPLIPTGRVAAKNGQEVTWFLNKIRDYENPPIPNSIAKDENEWMKKILHFGGGSNSVEQSGFVGYLDSYKSLIEDTLFGGDVTSFFKNSTAPIQSSLADTIKGYIQDGVTLMTFLGHASATGGFDQNIDDVSLWPDQEGKYPFLLGLGCHAGDIHLRSANSTSEEYVIHEDKGVIGYLSSVSLETAFDLNSYAKDFYERLSYKNYGKSIGVNMKNISALSLTNSATLKSINLHGDPSLVINYFDLPDYMVEVSAITFSPLVVTSDIDSFDVKILVTNLGRAIDTSIVVELIRDYPESSFSDTTYTRVIVGPNYQESISIRLPVDVVKGLGINTFTVEVDLPSFVDESYDISNNSIIQTLNILSGEIIPVYPYEFMIVPDTLQYAITLKASTAFAFEPAKDYIFEIDTTDYFNSPIKQSTTINSAGGIVEWTPSIYSNFPVNKDSVVYFWRVSKDSVNATGYSWRERSFQRILAKEGWQQDHFFQFKNDEYQFVNHNRSIRQFEFVNDLKDLKVTNQGKADLSELNDVGYFMNGDVLGSNAYDVPTSIHVAVLDSITLEPWSAEQLNLGQTNIPGTNSGGPYENYFVFRHNPTQMVALESFLNAVPNGNHIIMWSCYILNLASFTTPMPVSLRSNIGLMGGSQISAITDLYPFIFYHQKGNLASTAEVVGNSISEKGLIFNKTLFTSANYGNIFSETFGPATSWDSLSWRMSSIEMPSTKDVSVLNVYGIDASGNETLIPSLSNLPTDSGDISIAGRVDAQLYPYLKLNTRMSDDSLLSSPQLDRWQVTYQGVPEAALDPKIYYSFQNDTVDEGIEIKMSIAVKNISPYDMDSLLILFTVLDKHNNLHFLDYPRQGKLPVDSVLIASITFPTIGFSGINSLLIDVNPNNDQLEQYHFNNTAQISFYVNADNVNPILDVTFDGIHILDGDIVSPEANIVMELTDENQFLLLNDTSAYAIYITRPNGAEKRIHFSDGGLETMQFVPAVLPKNNSKIILQGDFDQDGEYKLRVQAKDRSENNSGSFDYIIGFEVINKSTITNIMNYPNPFTTSTRFVFTLTGSEVPEVFKIQIMTITGKVVREIHKDELGPINIGRNISDFAWDGTDTYGDRLANGLYLYHVITQINSEEIEHRETSGDGYFKKGFGKMYLFK